MRFKPLQYNMQHLPYIGLVIGVFISFAAYYFIQAIGNENTAPLILFLMLALSYAVFLYVRQLQRLVEIEKIKELERVKTDFLATISHEIRTPMNGILGMAELAMDAGVSSEVQAYMRVIMNSGETLMNIISDILDFSKIEAGKLSIEPIAVDMVELVDDVALLYAVPARDKAIELVVDYKIGSTQFVYADPLRVRQIIGNLLSNAIKFTPKGHVTLTVEELRNHNDDGDIAHLLFTVEDTGVGIAANAMDDVFEKFSQLSNIRHAEYGGTGLGLSICKSLTDMMSGEIGVDSKVGRGSKFWFMLPLPRDAKKALPQLVTEEHEELRDLRVLVVDDLDVTRFVVREKLNDLGMCCETAASAAEALLMMQDALNQNDPYQIILIDYLMPYMDGMVLAHNIKSRGDLGNACLILLTSAGAPFADETFIANGFSAYIAKPITNHSLVNSLSYIWTEYQKGHKRNLIHIDDGPGQAVSYNNNAEPEIIGKHVLVAEDNLVNQVFIREIIEGMGAQCHVVPNGKAALKYVRDNPNLDLVIMDALMPEMDGYEATRRICQAKEFGDVRPDLPIIALTASAMSGDRQRCLDVGMDDFLTKPIRKRALKEAVYYWVEKKHFSGHRRNDPRLELYRNNTQNLTKILDLDEIKHARAVLKNKFTDMVATYLETSKTRLEEIVKSIELGDVETLIRAAHSLKSSSQQMGAIQLSQIAMTMENTAKQMAQNDHVLPVDCHALSKDVSRAEATLRLTEDAFGEIAA